MITLKLRSDNFKKVVSAAVKALKAGQILICPTDTVYGLIGNFSDKKSVAKIYAIKNRPRNKPVSVFVENIAMAKRLIKINKEQESFLRQVWPGPVICVLPAKKGESTIGIRAPKHKFIVELIRRVGPLAQTSANIADQPASTKISQVLAQFEGKEYQPDLVIDAKNLKPAKPSMVVDLTISPFRVLRS